MKLSTYNLWPMWLGIKPYARQWLLRGIKITIDIFNNSAWLRVVIEIFRCNIIIFGFGYDRRGKYFWGSLGVLGLGVWGQLGKHWELDNGS